MICSQNINDHLLLHYSFDGNFNGESVHVNNGNNHGATFTEDRFVNPHSACYIKGIDNYIEFPNIRELKPDLPVSMAFWIKYGSDSYMDRAVLGTSFEEDRNAGVDCIHCCHLIIRPYFS